MGDPVSPGVGRKVAEEPRRDRLSRPGTAWKTRRTNCVTALGFAWSAGAWPPPSPKRFACPSVLRHLLCPGPVLDAEGGGLRVWLCGVGAPPAGGTACESGASLGNREGFPEEVAFMLDLEKRGAFERGRKWGKLGKGRDVRNNLETSLHSRASPSPHSARSPGRQKVRCLVFQFCK